MDFRVTTVRLLANAVEAVFIEVQPVVLRNRIADIVEKQGRRSGKLVFWKMLTEFRDQNGILVAEDLTTSVETENAPSSESSDVTPASERAPFSHDEGAQMLRAIEPAQWKDLKKAILF